MPIPPGRVAAYLRVVAGGQPARPIRRGSLVEFMLSVSLLIIAVLSLDAASLKSSVASRGRSGNRRRS